MHNIAESRRPTVARPIYTVFSFFSSEARREVERTLGHADLLPVLALELVLLEGALPLLDVGLLLVLVEVQDEEAQLTLEHVLLPLGQLLLALTQELFVGLLLQRRLLQLLLAASQLLAEGARWGEWRCRRTWSRSFGLWVGTFIYRFPVSGGKNSNQTLEPRGNGFLLQSILAIITSWLYIHQRQIDGQRPTVCSFAFIH